MDGEIGRLPFHPGIVADETAGETCESAWSEATCAGRLTIDLGAIVPNFLGVTRSLKKTSAAL
ncbi:hypothetical protein ACLBXJ_04020 [Methylobacterium mesophilicum]